MSKNGIIDELFEIFDSICEKSFNNRNNLESLQLKHPSNESVLRFQLVAIDQYESPSRQQLKQFTMDQLQYIYEEAQQSLDAVMNEELQIQKLVLRINRKPVSPVRTKFKKEESWNFLLQWPKTNNIDHLNMHVNMITNNIYQELQKSIFTQKRVLEANHQPEDYYTKYVEATQYIEQLEQQLEQQQDSLVDTQLESQCYSNVLSPQQSNQKPIRRPDRLDSVNRMQLINDLESKIEKLENENTQSSLCSMDAINKLLQNSVIGA